MDIVRFALLGLGSGAIYALIADGVVLIYRGSGVLNFSQSAVGMLGAFVYYDLYTHGWPKLAALAVGVVGAAVTSALIHLLVMRPLRSASALTRLLASLGVFTLIESAALKKWGANPRLVDSLLPQRVVHPFKSTPVTEDRLFLLLIAVVATVVLHLVYSRTKFGLATSAVAENDRALAALGHSPEWVAAVNWTIGGALAGGAVILIVPISGLDVPSASLLVLEGLAAALVGGFRSFPLTLAGGLIIGVAESEISRYVTTPGWNQSAPFLLIIAVLAVRGRALPLRGEIAMRPPELGSGRVRPVFLLVAVVAAFILFGFVLNANWVAAGITTMSIALVLLSLVVVTGYCGQISLAQLTLAGMGAWSTSRLMVNYGLPAELAIVIGVMSVIPIGIVFALPALRTRGVNLAVATLGLAVVLQSLILFNSRRTGGLAGTTIQHLRLFGFDITGPSHPGRYACFCLILLVAGVLAVAALRRGQAGRRLIAVRTSERAATALGINVFAAKLFAFGLGAALAALGGILMALRNPSVVFTQFDVVSSISIVLLAVIGGAGYVTGAIIGAVAAPGGLGAQALNGLFGDVGQWIQIASSALLLIVLIVNPDGIAAGAEGQWRAVVAWVQRRVRTRERGVAAAPTTPEAVELKAGGGEEGRRSLLEVRDVTVAFGGVRAVESVSLTVRPGEVVGLVGPNGAGKTTLIDAITGFVRPASGDVLLDGASIISWPARKRARAGVARTFQSLELFESMTVRENLEAAADDHRLSAYFRDMVLPRDRPLPWSAIEALHDFGLDSDLNRRPEELSFGRRRMVAIARALAGNPSVLLLDEPAAGLDNVETAELGQLIRALATERGCSILLIEHDVSLVWSICDRVTVLDFGRVIADGTPEELRNDPAVIEAYVGSEEPGSMTKRTLAALDGVADELVDARSISVGYNDVPAVREVDLAVRKGEVVALFGPNGAGKSTMLRALAGELRPLSGSVDRQGDADWKHTHRLARAGLAFVPQERSTFMGLTVLENLRLGRGDPEVAFTIFPELRPLTRRRAGLLSGGEQQMLSLARALASRPTLLLADELSLGLAPLATARLLDAVRDSADEGVGCLIVEQQFHRALAIADRVYVMNRGRIVLADSASNVDQGRESVWQLYLAGELSAEPEGDDDPIEPATA